MEKGLQADVAEQPAGKSPTGTHWPALDGIRAVAVTAVIAYHVDPKICQGGFLGVDAFFVLSGFLITHLLLREFEKTGHLRFANFYARRALRLLPALVVVVIASAFASHTSISVTATRVTATIFYVANWLIVVKRQNIGLFNHMWSLAIEEQFYLLWPILLLVCTKRWGRRGLSFACVLAIAAMTIRRAELTSAGAQAWRLYYGTDTRGEPLFVGCLFASIWPQMAGARSARTIRALAPVAMIIFVATLLFWHDRWALALYDRGGLTIFACVVAVVIASGISDTENLVSRTLSLKPLVYAGRVSYGMYLWHPLVIWSIGSTSILPLRFVLVFAGTLAVAWASFRWIERPFLRLKWRFA
jgi:peptidoglycan/LPS O-acetylase OafA/YrhL